MRAVSADKAVRSSDSVPAIGSQPRKLSRWIVPAILLMLSLPDKAWAQLTLTIGDREQVIVELGRKLDAPGSYMGAKALVPPKEPAAPKEPGEMEVPAETEVPAKTDESAKAKERAKTKVRAEAKERDAPIFEARTYRNLSVEWEKDTTVTVLLYGEMMDGPALHREPVVKNCGRLPVGETRWTLGPDDLVCDNKFIDKSALIEFWVDDPDGPSGYFYVRVYNRKFPMAGSDAGIVLTLTERLKSSDDSDKGFSATDGLSVYYAVSRLKSQQWRGIVHVAALDQLEDDKDLEVGLGLGFLFRSNGFLDTNTGLSLAGGIGYNLMIPDSSERWYWFVGLGTNFDLGKKE